MKRFLFLLLLIAVTKVKSQSVTNCNILNLTLDNANQVIDIENQPINCGTDIVNKCKYVIIKFTKTINSTITPVNVNWLRFEPPQDNSYLTNLSKNYIRIINPLYGPNLYEYKHTVAYKHEFLINDPAPGGSEFHCLICPGSEIGPRKVRFQYGLSASSIPIATNVSFYNPNVPGIKPGIKWKSIKNKYYMVYRTANPTSNSALSPINNLTEWVKGTGKIMFMQDLNSHQNGRQYMYIVASSNSPKPYYTGTNGGSYSTPILGCNGQIIFPF